MLLGVIDCATRAHDERQFGHRLASERGEKGKTMKGKFAAQQLLRTPEAPASARFVRVQVRILQEGKTHKAFEGPWLKTWGL